MFEVRPFNPFDLREFVDEAAEVSIRPYLRDLDPSTLSGSGPGWIGRWNGKPVGCAGFAEAYGKDSIRAVAWAILLPSAKEVIVPICRSIRRAIERTSYRRIEAHVEAGHFKARRLVETLGFRIETREKLMFFPDGGACIEYVIIR